MKYEKPRIVNLDYIDKAHGHHTCGSGSRAESYCSEGALTWTPEGDCRKGLEAADFCKRGTVASKCAKGQAAGTSLPECLAGAIY